MQKVGYLEIFSFYKVTAFCVDRLRDQVGRLQIVFLHVFLQFFLINNFFHISIRESFLPVYFCQIFMIITFSNFFFSFCFCKRFAFRVSGILELLVLTEDH